MFSGKVPGAPPPPGGVGAAASGPASRTQMGAAPTGGGKVPRLPMAGAGGVPQGFQRVPWPEGDPRPDAPPRCVCRWTVPEDPAGSPPMQLAAAARRSLGKPSPDAGVKQGQMIGELECSKGGKIMWQDTVESPATVMAGCGSFCAVATHAGYLHLFSPAGRRLAGAICLGLGVKFLCIDTKHRLLVVTHAGDVIIYVRDTTALFLGFKCELRESARPLLLSNPPIDIVSATISLNGTPLLTGADGDTYALDRVLRVWVKVLDPVIRAAVGTAHVVSGVPDQPPAAPPGAEAAGVGGVPGARTGPVESESAYALERARLESMVGASHMLQHATGLRSWMSKYAHFLARHGDVGRLRELCEECLANVLPSNTSTGAPRRKRPALDANDAVPPRGEQAAAEGKGPRTFVNEQTGEERRDLPMDTLVRDCILPAIISHGAELSGLREEVEAILQRAGY